MCFHAFIYIPRLTERDISAVKEAINILLLPEQHVRKA